MTLKPSSRTTIRRRRSNVDTSTFPCTESPNAEVSQKGNHHMFAIHWCDMSSSSRPLWRLLHSHISHVNSLHVFRRFFAGLQTSFPPLPPPTSRPPNQKHLLPFALVHRHYLGRDSTHPLDTLFQIWPSSQSLPLSSQQLIDPAQLPLGRYLRLSWLGKITWHSSTRRGCRCVSISISIRLINRWHIQC